LLLPDTEVFWFGPERRGQEIAGKWEEGQGAQAHVREGETVGAVCQLSMDGQAVASAGTRR